MKKIWSLIMATLILAMSFMTVPVSAEFTVDDIEIEPNVYNIKVTVMSDKSGVMTAMLTNADNSILYGMKSDRTPEMVTTANITEYKYEFSFRMRSSVLSGTYAITVGNNVEEITKQFSYVRIDDKLDFYRLLESKSVEEITNYIKNHNRVPVEPAVLNIYKGITDTDLLEFVNSEINELILDTTITPVEGKTEDQLKEEKVEELDNIFIPKFNELMEIAKVALVDEVGWTDFTSRAIGGTLDDYFYDTVLETSYFYTNQEAVLDVADAFENFVVERAEVEEFTLAEYSKAFDRATLVLIENTRSFGVLKDAFIYFKEQGSITPDMTNIQALIDGGNDFELWQDLAEMENTDCATLVANAETIAEDMTESNPSGGTTDEPLGGTSTPVDRPITGGGGSLGGGGYTKPTTPVDPEPVTPSGTFSDIDSVAWAKESIEALAERGVINGKGDGKFAPNDSVTREEFVKIIIGAFDLLNEDAKADFDDVDATRWSYAFIATANELGIVSGDGVSFNPKGEMSRQDMAVVIFRTAEKLGIELGGDAAEFKDAANIADYAKDAVNALTAVGIINGMGDGTFAPKSTVTRAQAAKVIYGLMNLVGGGK